MSYDFYPRIDEIVDEINSILEGEEGLIQAILNLQSTEVDVFIVDLNKVIDEFLKPRIISKENENGGTGHKPNSANKIREIINLVFSNPSVWVVDHDIAKIPINISTTLGFFEVYRDTGDPVDFDTFKIAVIDGLLSYVATIRMVTSIIQGNDEKLKELFMDSLSNNASLDFIYPFSKGTSTIKREKELLTYTLSDDSNTNINSLALEIGDGFSFSEIDPLGIFFLHTFVLNAITFFGKQVGEQKINNKNCKVRIDLQRFEEVNYLIIEDIGLGGNWESQEQHIEDIFNTICVGVKNEKNIGLVVLDFLEQTKDQASKIGIIYLIHKFIEQNTSEDVPLDDLEKFRTFIDQNIIQFRVVEGGDDGLVQIKEIRIPLALMLENTHQAQPSELVTV